MGTKEDQNATALNLNKVAPDPRNVGHVRIHDGHVITVDSDTESKHVHDCVEDPPVLSADAVRALVSAGMTEPGIQGWREFHESVATAMFSFFGSVTIMFLGLCYILIFGMSFNRYIQSIPLSITIALVMYYIAAIWRHGPAAARSRLYLMSLPVAWVCWSTAFTVTFIGPLDQVPFGSLIHFVIAVSVCMLSGNMANKSGMLFTEKPKQPRATLLKPMLQSIVFTLRAVDNFTDISFVRILFNERQEECVWFGEPGRCGVITWLLAASAISSLGDFLVTLFLMVLGSEVTKTTDWRKRAMLGLHVAALCFELGVVSITLLSLMSELEHPELQGGNNAAKQNQIWATAVSLATTFTTFGVTMLGAGDAVQGLKKIGKRVSSVRHTIASRMSSAGSCMYSRPGSVAGERLVFRSSEQGQSGARK